MANPNRFELTDLSCLVTPQQAEVWYEPLLAAFKEFGLTNARRQAMALAQFAHESGGFQILEENLNYSANRLIATWPSRFRAPRSDENIYADSFNDGMKNAFAYDYQPEKLANYVYGGRLGNAFVGDGYLYRGRGIVQTTGRANYAAAGQALGLNLVLYPELLFKPTNAARAACWFVSTRRLLGISWLTYADWGNLSVCTRLINGGLIGLESRQKWYAKAKQCLQMV